VKDDESARSQVEGNRNQFIETNFGTAITNVAGDVFLNQPPPKALSLHQLDADIADFTGRENEIELILGHLKDKETVAISAVSGMPGVGKSALAIHVAHQLAKTSFPDVQLYINLRGDDGGVLSPADVLAQWLRAFGLDESSMPRDLRERSSLFRSQLSGKRAILVLDNAQDDSQVRPLLPGCPTCVAIVTSRRVLGALEGATVVELDVLSESKALEFLERLIGQERVQKERQAAQEIVRLCGKLPLAIRIVGGTLKTKRHWTLSHYAQQLADEKQRLNHLQLSNLDVRASFELSYRELTDTDAELFYRLGTLEGKEFGFALASAVIGKESNSGDGLERLADVQLLEALEGHRYRFHDLIRVFAREKLVKLVTLDHQKTIKQSIADFLIEWSGFMNYLLTPQNRQKIVQEAIKKGESSSLADEQILNLTRIVLNSIAQEREHLLSALHWVNDAMRWNAVMGLTTNLVDFFDTKSYWQDWEQSCLMAVTAAQNADHPQGEAAMYNNLGALYQTQSRWEEAMISYQKSLKIKRALSDRHG
jgi:tetratricopeptide (TPR) repeat protein